MSQKSKLNINRKGCLVVISGPSGVGKGTLCKMLLSSDENTVFSISATTRKPREGEEDGVHYYFIDDTTFEKMIEENAFLEYANLYGLGRRYGTPRKEVEKRLEEGKDVILDIDVEGARNIKKQMQDAVLVFIAPPSMQELQNRLQLRGTEEKEEIERRLQVATDELKTAEQYDYLVINDNLEKALQELKQIVAAERLKTKRNENWLTNFWEGNKI